MRIARHAHLLISLIAILVSAVAMQAATTTIVATPSPVNLTYTKGGTLTSAKVTIGPSAGTTGSIYFTLNPATLPPWLQVDKTNGTATAAAPVQVSFSPSLVAANSPAGFYSAGIEVDSANLTPVTITVNMTVSNAAPTITSTLQILPNANWTPGSNLPTGILTVKSSGDPVYFTASASAAWITLGATTDVAFSWGTNIAVTFAQSMFDNPMVNSTLSGTITVKAGSQTQTNTVTITIGQPIATISGILPKQLPQVIAPASATRTIAVQGSSFANGMDVRLGGPAGPKVPYNCTTFATVTTDAWCLQSSTQFFLKFSSATLASAATASPTNQLLLYLSAGVPAAGGNPAIPGQIAIQVVTTPIVSAVTDAASFVQPGANQSLKVAPYEMLSIFGDNFGTPGASSGIAFNQQGRLPNSLTDASSNLLRVHFTDAAGNALAADSDGYLLLWTPNQINVLAPSNLPFPGGGQELKLSVQVGSFASTPDAISTFDVVTASPNLLTLGGTQAVVVNPDNSVNSSTSPAKFGSNVTLYLSGMGDPKDGSAVAGNQGQPAPGYAACAEPGSYLAAKNALLSPGSPWLSFDGAIVENGVLGTLALPPCFDPSKVTIKFGTLNPLGGLVTYAGFTPDSVAGLYQVNMTVPASSSPSLTGLTPAASAAATATQYLIQVLINGGTSQAGVNVYLIK